MIKLNKFILCALFGATLIANGMESAHTELVPARSLMSRLASTVVDYIKHPATRFGSAIGLTLGLAFSGAAAYSIPVLATIGGLAAASIMLSPAEAPAVETHPAKEPVGIPNDETPEVLAHRMHVAAAVIFIDNNDALTPLHAEIIEEGTNNWFHVRFEPEYRIYYISQEPGVNPDGVEFLEELVPADTTYSMHLNQFVDVGPVAMLWHYKQLCSPPIPPVLTRN